MSGDRISQEQNTHGASDAPVTQEADMDTITFETKTAVQMTPQVLARLFAELDDTKQADFFEEVGRIAEEDWKHGQMQWCYLGDRLRERGPNSHAFRFACDIGAFAMLNTWRHFNRMGVYP